VTTPADKPRGPGRPRRADGPVDYNAIDKLLVSGEDVMGPDGARRHRFPSFREIGGRFGVSHSLVAKYAREHNCVERRAYATTVKPARAAGGGRREGRARVRERAGRAAAAVHAAAGR
jgi:hypothetical protein